MTNSLLLKLLSSLLINLLLVDYVLGSIGDRTEAYFPCLVRCASIRCKNADDFKRQPSLSLSLLFWTCREDCGYRCMWEIVEDFQKNGQPIPQFYGKWPFVRLLGLQEPASVFFSLLNLAVHVYMFREFGRKVRSQAPMKLIWTYFSLICMHGWIWSTIFHARDKPVTEVMDYSCAFTMVLTLPYCLLSRLLYKHKKAIVVLTCTYLGILYKHLTHLWSGRIDYKYNMEANVGFALLTVIISLIWWQRSHRVLPHLEQLKWFSLLSVMVAVLELADFPPIFWVFDAHSLWHAATAPVTFSLYRFIIADCLYLRKFDNKEILDGHLH